MTQRCFHLLPIEVRAEDLGRVLRGGRIDREGRRALETGDDPQTRMDLPVPVERLVEPLARGRRVEEQVVGRVAERVERVERPLERGRGVADRLVVESGEVRGMRPRRVGPRSR